MGDRFLDQTVISGHEERLADLDLLLDLGLKAVRYPVLWERTVDHQTNRLDWRFADERLGRLRELGINPIVGLVHHGSGPPHTSLLDDEFPTGLASYASEVANRYPWADAYTPVNEPMTTARFSCLYGHWYPHRRDPQAWARALLNQTRATIMAMKAIREVNPKARLVQTDDLGKVSSHDVLRNQRDFENERRWLGWDLLCGRVDHSHPLRGHLVACGISVEELDWVCRNPCSPNVIGVNYYPSSERFLDPRLGYYPAERQGNHRPRYVDTLTARACKEGIYGPERLLREAWERYHIPVAITECHNSGHREEQVRWLMEVWDGAVAASAAGAEVEAVTIWALLGSFDWDRLVTETRGYYEPGPYDLRSPRPRPTALAAATRSLSHGLRPDLPGLDRGGWWRREDRFDVPPLSVGSDEDRLRAYGRHGANGRNLRQSTSHQTPFRRTLVILHADSPVGRALVRACEARALDCLPVHSEQLTSFACRPDEIPDSAWAVVDAATVYGPEGRAVRPQLVRDGAISCASRNIPFVVFSSSRVFDSRSGRTRVESDPADGTSLEGAALREVERTALLHCPRTLVLRTGDLFGTGAADDPIVGAVVNEYAWPAPVSGLQLCSPTFVVDLANTSLDLAIDGESGIWHLVNGNGSRATAFPEEPERTTDMYDALPARSRSVLGSERGRIMPELQDAIQRASDELRSHRPAKLA